MNRQDIIDLWIAKGAKVLWTNLNGNLFDRRLDEWFSYADAIYDPTSNFFQVMFGEEEICTEDIGWYGIQCYVDTSDADWEPPAEVKIPASDYHKIQCVLSEDPCLYISNNLPEQWNNA